MKWGYYVCILPGELYQQGKTKTAYKISWAQYEIFATMSLANVFRN
jgi:hypothetical protein